MLRAAPLAFIPRMGRAARFLHLLLSLTLCSVAIRLMIDAGIGASPWDVFHIGLSHKLPMTVGQASIVAGMAVVLTAWLGFHEKYGIGTIMNVLLIGLQIDLFAPFIPHPHQLAWQWTQFLLGITLAGFGTAAYLSAGFGAGPRDGLMMALHRQYGWPVARIRTSIEVSILLLGVLLGGPAGWGTLAFALLMGPSVGYGLRLFGFKRD